MSQLPAVAYRIKPGDTLTAIAQAMLGSSREWPRIYAFNNMEGVLSRGGARISNPDKIRAGDTIFLPLLGPPRPPGPVVPSPAANRMPALMTQIGTTSIPFCAAHEVSEHLVTLDYGTHISRVNIVSRFSITKSAPVMLTQVMGRTFELTAQTESAAAYTRLVSDTKVSYDPKTGLIGVSCGLITHANGIEMPKAVLGIPGIAASGMPVLRAEIRTPELKGQIDNAYYTAVSVKFSVEIEGKMPPMRLAPVPVPVTRKVTLPLPEFDRNELFQTPPFMPVVVVLGVAVIAAIALWVYLPVALGLTAAQLAKMAGAALLASSTLTH